MTDDHDPNDRHAPTDEFIEYLARDIRRAARHDARFAASGSVASPPPARRYAMAVGIAAGVVLTLFTGIVLGASASYAVAATPSESRSPFAFPPLTNAIHVISCAAGTPSPAPATGGSFPAGRVAVVDLPKATIRSAQSVGAVLNLIQRIDGRVLVDDQQHRQLRLFEPDLAASMVLFDSIAGPAKNSASAGLGAIGSGRGARLLFAFPGDSVVFGPDGGPEQNLLVMDGRGRAARTMALSIGAPSGFPEGGAYFDGRGRLIYRHSPTTSVPQPFVEVPVPPRRAGAANPFGGRGAESGTMRVYVGRPDTLPILRMDFETRVIDTVGDITLPPDGHAGDNGLGNGGGKLVAVYGTDGKPTGAKQMINPLVTVDDWAVLSDGTIAFVRGRDYHVDWLRPDGTRTASAPLPFAWQRLTDGDKQRLVDSTRAVVDSLDAIADRNWTRGEAQRDSLRSAMEASRGSSAGVGRRGVGAGVGVARGRGAGDGSAAVVGRSSARGMPPTTPVRAPVAKDGPAVRSWPYEVVPLSQIADFYPPIRPGAAKPDADGNLWILPSTSSTASASKGALVYDLVNPTAGLVRRVRLPEGRTLAGFGKGGVVYLQAGDPAKGYVLERTTLPALGR